MKILLIFFYIFKEIQSQSIVKFNFTTKLPNIENITNETFYKINRNDINVPFCLGTPKQCCNLLIDFSYYHLVIISSSVSNVEIKINKFNENSSSTYKCENNKTKHYFFSDFHILFPSKESFYINNEIISSNDFFLATKLTDYKSKEKYDYLCGGIGLGIYGKNLDFPNSNLITNLKKKNIINTYDFTIKYFDNEKGELIIGNKPHEYDSKNFKFENYVQTKSPSSTKDKWSIFFDKLSYGNNDIDNIDFNLRTNCIFSLNEGLIMGDGYYKNIIDEYFFNEEIKKGNCFVNVINYVYIYYYCNIKNIDFSKMKKLQMYNKEMNYTFEFTYQDLFYEENGFKYFLIRFYNRTSKNGVWFLGKPFFKKYQLTFNLDSKIIGFYKPILKKNIFSHINTFLILFFGILITTLLIYIIIFKLRKPRKLRANELNDEYDYTTQINKLNNNIKNKLLEFDN